MPSKGSICKEYVCTKCIGWLPFKVWKNGGCITFIWDDVREGFGILNVMIGRYVVQGFGDESFLMFHLMMREAINIFLSNLRFFIIFFSPFGLNSKSCTYINIHFLIVEADIGL